VIVTPRTWVPIASWWLPVVVTLRAERGPRDALEMAVLALVAIHVDRAEAIAHELCIDVGLVDSAAHHLVACGGLAIDDAGILAIPSDSRGQDETADNRDGWLAWDARQNRPLLQLWLDDEVPSGRIEPAGWRVLEPVCLEVAPGRPSRDDVRDRVQQLAAMAELRIFEPFGSGRREVEGGLVAKLRLKTDAHFKLASIWVPVEQRALGAVVWRPSLVPTAEVQAELDPGGWSGLLLAVAAPVRVELEEERQAFADLVMPGIVQQAGFASVEELRLAVRGEARKLVGDARLSEALQRLVEEAIQMQWLGQVVGADWRMLAKPWTAVLDLALAEVCLDLRPVVDALWDSGLPPLLPGWPQNWVGPSEAHVLQVVKKPKQELGQLRKRLDDQTDPLGHRVLVLALCLAVDAESAARYRPALRRCPRLFFELALAVRARNSVDHVRAETEFVEVEVFRARVLAILGAFAVVWGSA
jgi:hypothetical protein